MPTYRLNGGPCDGQTRSYPTLSAVPFFIECGGAEYLFESLGTPRFVFTGSGVSSTTEGALGTHAPKGWHDLQLSVNRRLPAALSRARRLRRATRHVMARKRRR